jgi:hypothetical protein
MFFDSFAWPHLFHQARIFFIFSSDLSEPLSRQTSNTTIYLAPRASSIVTFDIAAAEYLLAALKILERHGSNGSFVVCPPDRHDEQ